MENNKLFESIEKLITAFKEEANGKEFDIEILLPQFLLIKVEKCIRDKWNDIEDKSTIGISETTKGELKFSHNGK